MNGDRHNEKRLTVEEILSWMNQLPAGSAPKFKTAVNWKSEFAGHAVRQLFTGKRLLDSMSLYSLLWGPGWSLLIDLQRRILENLFIDPMITAARIAVRTGRHPDIFAEQNEWTKSTYAKLIYDLCGQCMSRGTFDRGKALRLPTTKEGKKFLKNSAAEFV